MSPGPFVLEGEPMTPAPIIERGKHDCAVCGENIPPLQPRRVSPFQQHFTCPTVYRAQYTQAVTALRALVHDAYDEGHNDRAILESAEDLQHPRDWAHSAAKRTLDALPYAATTPPVRVLPEVDVVAEGLLAAYNRAHAFSTVDAFRPLAAQIVDALAMNRGVG